MRHRGTQGGVEARHADAGAEGREMGDRAAQGKFEALDDTIIG